MGMHYIIFPKKGDEFQQLKRRVYRSTLSEVKYADTGSLDLLSKGCLCSVKKQQIYIVTPFLQPWQQIYHKLFRATGIQRCYNMENLHIFLSLIRMILPGSHANRLIIESIRYSL